MTRFVNPKELGKDLVPHLVDMTKSGADQIGGFVCTFDCTGNVMVMRQALEAGHRGWGQSIVIGVAPAGAEISTRPFQLVTGRVWKGTAFGGARGRTDVPKIVDWYIQGKIEIDPMITHVMPLAEINNAFELMKRGESIRGVVTFYQGRAPRMLRNVPPFAAWCAARPGPILFDQEWSPGSGGSARALHRVRDMDDNQE
jgi:S-(hydroxymethyl)glutathione dehydrogenase/alcohol dehydrogenase